MVKEKGGGVLRGFFKSAGLGLAIDGEIQSHSAKLLLA